MQGINLVFPCISFGESGLFNGLRATWARDSGGNAVAGRFTDPTTGLESRSTTQESPHPGRGLVSRGGDLRLLGALPVLCQGDVWDLASGDGFPHLGLVRGDDLVVLGQDLVVTQSF